MKSEATVLSFTILLALYTTLLQTGYGQNLTSPSSTSNKISTPNNETRLNQSFTAARGNLSENINGTSNTSLANNAMMSKGS